MGGAVCSLARACVRGYWGVLVWVGVLRARASVRGYAARCVVHVSSELRTNARKHNVRAMAGNEVNANGRRGGLLAHLGTQSCLHAVWNEQRTGAAQRLLHFSRQRLDDCSSHLLHADSVFIQLVCFSLCVLCGCGCAGVLRVRFVSSFSGTNVACAGDRAPGEPSFVPLSLHACAYALCVCMHRGSGM